MKFQHNRIYDPQFDQIPDIIWYPYVGERFGHSPCRVMVYGHNAYMDAATYAQRKADFDQKSVWADCVEEYTYEKGWWTQAFRYFIKGAVGLSENFGYDSGSGVIHKVDDFVGQIAYINFIQGLVQSENALTSATPETIERSQEINRRILEILTISHCICWGSPVFEYVSSIKGVSILTEEGLGQKGFAYRLIQNDQGRKMHLLKIHHPSMPGFRPYSIETQAIISSFLSKP